MTIPDDVAAFLARHTRMFLLTRRRDGAPTIHPMTGFFADAPQALWPRAIVIEHLSKDEWLNDCIADMRARGYVEKGRTRSNTLLARG